jgi:hypothetical protein
MRSAVGPVDSRWMRRHFGVCGATIPKEPMTRIMIFIMALLHISAGAVLGFAYPPLRFFPCDGDSCMLCATDVSTAPS